MIKKKKCRACGFKFRLEKENRYLAESLIGSVSEKPNIYEMFDCPNCGCQNAVGVYGQPIEENINSNEEWQEVTEKEYAEFAKN